MTTITSVVGDSREPRQPHSPYLLIHNIMRVLAADGCEKISVTGELSGNFTVQRPRSVRPSA